MYKEAAAMINDLMKTCADHVVGQFTELFSWNTKKTKLGMQSTQNCRKEVDF